jgi:hypothetical protein
MKDVFKTLPAVLIASACQYIEPDTPDEFVASACRTYLVNVESGEHEYSDEIRQGCTAIVAVADERKAQKEKQDETK